jgi:hypothetical protein
MKLYSIVFYVEIFSLGSDGRSSLFILGSGDVLSGDGEGDEVLMGPGEEASGNTSEDSREAVGSDDVVVDGTSSEELHGHAVVGYSDSGVERSTGVGTSDENHGSEGHGDSEDTEHTLVFLSVCGELESLGVLADEVGHDEDEGAHELNPESLPFSDASGSKVRELGSTLSRSGFLVLNKGVDGAGSENTSDNLRLDHAYSLGKVLHELVVRSSIIGQAESSVD